MGTDPNLVRQWFQQIDTDRSGELTAAELQRALQLGNLNYGLNDVDQMIRAFDTRGRRKLNMQEFERLHQFLCSIQSSFFYFDKDRSGSLSGPEVMQALQHAGFNLDQPVLYSMMQKYDPDVSGTLTLDEYIRMCLFLQSCVRTFSAFDAQRQGRITMDFNQFVYACSHIS